MEEIQTIEDDDFLYEIITILINLFNIILLS